MKVELHSKGKILENKIDYYQSLIGNEIGLLFRAKQKRNYELVFKLKHKLDSYKTIISECTEKLTTIKKK